ncbi:MAG TPA: helix-turn-helix transcriptional regulator [Vicinamibacteria bacterium]|nr:helix-turn-helix transcriptional regulator [Vicinamibacteria bacterium]
MLNVRALRAFIKARGWSQAELARRIGVSRQAVSLWFRGDEANVQGKHLLKLSEVLGVSAEELTKPLPCFEPEAHDQLLVTLLWDRVYPDLDDFAVALNARDPRAIGRFVEVYGLYAAEATLGAFVWDRFPDYERHIHPARRRELRTLWSWHENRTAA